MIGRLSGILLEKSAEAVLIDVGGVGYEVFCPLTTIDRLAREGEKCTLSIHTHVREDQLILFGFSDADERGLFRLLTSVSGVGPKLALACLSGLNRDELASALMSEDVKKLSSIPGIGKRTAERLILELKDRIAKGFSPSKPVTRAAHQLDDLDSALRNLGYRPKDVDQLIEKLRSEADGMTFEMLLRKALSMLNRA